MQRGFVVNGWDIDVDGVEFVTGLVGLAMQDMSKDVEAYGTDVQSAAASAGTVSGFYCGPAPTGAVGAALALFAEGTAQDVAMLAARAAKSVNGAHEATGYYILGDEEMAAQAQHRALAAPEVDLPGRGDGGGHK
nr:DUF6507 family protein [Streptomyces sp. SID4926]